MHSKRLREKVKRDYNAIAGAFSQTRQSGWKEFEDFFPFLKPKMKILDLGCGNGRLVDFLKSVGIENYTGFDQSEELLKLAQKAHPRTCFELYDMGELPSTREKWDAIFMVASLHHLSPKDQKKCMLWAHEHLKENGLLLMTNWNLFQWRFWASWLKGLFFPLWGYKGLSIPWNREVDRYYYAFTLRELLSLHRETGFTLVISKKGRNFVTVARA